MTQSDQTSIDLTLADAVILELAAGEIGRWCDALARRGIDLQDVGIATSEALRLADRIRRAEVAE